ncbi:MAG: hypothetical protein AAFX54_05060 [Pseudomonadota bacterium]
MKSLKTLGAVAIGSIVLSATYALAIKDHSTRLDVEDDGERSIRHTVNGDRGEFVRRNDESTLEATWRGDFELTDDGDGISSIEKKLEIEFEDDDEIRRALFEKDGDGVGVSYFVDGERQPAGADTDSAISALLLEFLRASGVQSDERVAALLKNGGVENVLTELEFLEGDHAFRLYAVALTEQSELSDGEVTKLADSLQSIESDHDLRLALRAILENETVSAETTPALINAASGIESDHDLRLLVEAFAERPLDADAMDLALDLYARIESDHDLRVSAEALLENGDLSPAQAARILKTAADTIESDHDMRLVLTQTAPMFSAEPELTDAWLDGFSALESGHDQRLSVEAVAEEAGHSPEAWTALIDASETIESDRDRRKALEAIAANFGDDASLIAAYRTVADKIESERERERALEAIGDVFDD